MGKLDGSVILGSDMEQDFYFNELSLEKKPDSLSVIQHLKDCYLKLKGNGFSVCRAAHDVKQEILAYITNISGIPKHTITSFIYSFFASPFEKNDITETIEEKFLSHDLYFDNKKANGLQWAFTYETLVLSFFTEDKWNCDFLGCFDKASDETVNIHNVCTVQNIINQQLWIDSLKDIELVLSSIPSDSKTFSPRDDHGKDILIAFWNKLKINEYVVSGINSLPFNPKYRNFIKEIGADGKIEIILHWTDEGFGLVIQTTGRNYRETKAISDILKQKYDI